MPGAVGAHPPVMEAQKVNALAPFGQVHDPGLGVLELKAQLRQDQPQRRKRRLGLRPRLAHRQQIIRETHESPAPALGQSPVPALGPLPVKPVE